MKERTAVSPDEFKASFQLGQRLEVRPFRVEKSQTGPNRKRPAGIIVTTLTTSNQVVSGFVPISMIPRELWEANLTEAIFGPRYSIRRYQAEIIDVVPEKQKLTFKLVEQLEPIPIL